ncbi:uncharacterized protein PHALS_08526 [Plasmopara halstedii]|uniref:Uncharacterized protein n=1 Tax=Plasmopara halstedii TaxID=4781 RepID=A0A0P1ACZ7_PLAHL|nr:uncharacterized protein PHALS_08526 [Plasmopara halstedii]CEG38452.1 hypothetical protein PHALS_08526 [Plasmopara halstedii]|eukprot:XP_024574821.1 hypothetical protein PHALS_08526 [Plasmopara halstedii]
MKAAVNFSPESNTSIPACLIVTTSGRILLLWDQDDSLPFQYPQLALFLVSLFHFGQSQSFGQLELQNGYTVIMTADVIARIIVVIICATPKAGDKNEVAPLQLERLASLIILQEFLRCFRSDINRLSMECIEQAKLMADEYTLTKALGGLQDGCEGTLDEFIVFQNKFVRRVIGVTSRCIQDSITSWYCDVEVIMSHRSSLAIRLARGFVMNGETNDIVYSTSPKSAGSFFDQDQASRQLHLVYKSARVQELVKQVAKALHECTILLTPDVLDEHGFELGVVIKFRHLSGLEVSELFIALRMLRTGTFMTGVVFYGDNSQFRGGLKKLQQVKAHLCGNLMLRLLQASSQDVELQIGLDGAPEEVWEAANMLLRPFERTVSIHYTNEDDRPKKSSSNTFFDPVNNMKAGAATRSPQLTENNRSQ